MAFCSNCGRELSPAALTCPHCGAATRLGTTQTTSIQTVVVAAPAEGQLEGFALASILCSIGSFLILPIVGSVLGIVFGNIANSKIDDDPRLRGREMARAGIIIGWVGVVLQVLAIIAIILFITAFTHAFE